MTIPLNRIVAFAGPYLSAAAGGLASWLVAKVNIIGLPGLDEHNLTTAIAGGLSWLLVAGLTWAGHSKWLTGHHLQMQADAQVSAAGMSVSAVTAPTAQGDAPVGYANGGGNGFHGPDIDEVIDPITETTGDQALVSDDEELAAPPPPANYTPAAEPELVS
jgi:hypothetical protein